MKFTTLTLLVLVTILQLSPTLIRATIANGPIEEKVTCVLMDVFWPLMVEHIPCLCQFIKGEWSRALFDSPGSHKTYKLCNIPQPKC
ncbi:hypothetical protein CARUB_v10018479mg [Capsella rubella]|uniref:Bifunctional inhibitor/plant lipid transfer protein/seed storage helical domain-containing protein n=1 Tax=Capsella rubella TaxID=81985 RepID=R0HDT1_9BRAS|nr:hypothetical protein CARUB_v10018479mg [Capsella rubella]